MQHNQNDMTVPRLSTAGRFDPASLFRPTTVAVVGADTECGAQFTANLALSGFKGDVQAVRDASQLTSAPSWPSWPYRRTGSALR